MKLAEALVLRKHLEAKVKQLEPIRLQGERGLLEVQTKRQAVSAEPNIDELVLQVPKVTLADVTAEYDKYSKALRQLDTSIQQTNWAADLATEVDLKDINI